jgi:hypothetical protein
MGQEDHTEPAAGGSVPYRSPMSSTTSGITGKDATPDAAGTIGNGRPDGTAAPPLEAAAHDRAFRVD